MDIRVIQVTPFQTNCYVLRDGDEAIVIDPGDVPSELLEAVDGYRLVAIVNTHGHCDHCGGNGRLMARTGARLLLHESDVPLLRTIREQGMMFGVPFEASPEPDGLLHEGDQLKVGVVELNVWHAPGHSPGHIMLSLENDGQAFVFTGDVLFAGSVGRTDLPGGDQDVLFRSIQRTLLPMRNETVAYPGHGPSTSIGIERRHNPFLSGL